MFKRTILFGGVWIALSIIPVLALRLIAGPNQNDLVIEDAIIAFRKAGLPVEALHETWGNKPDSFTKAVWLDDPVTFHYHTSIRRTGEWIELVTMYTIRLDARIAVDIKGNGGTILINGKTIAIESVDMSTVPHPDALHIVHNENEIRRSNLLLKIDETHPNWEQIRAVFRTIRRASVEEHAELEREAMRIFFQVNPSFSEEEAPRR